MSKKSGNKGASKGGGSGNRLVTTMAMTGGVFVMRKLLATVWTKVTGRTPPTDLTDPGVNLLEVLAWSVATGLIVETARYAIIRGTMKQSAAEAEV
jgi:Protein of unknown function (DUF4235)